MCLALLDAGRWTVSELADGRRRVPATASEHVVRLAEGGLVTTEVQGRHKYVSLAGPHVAEVLERLSALRDPEPPRSLAAVRDRRRFAAGRTCYDHLAGRARRRRPRRDAARSAAAPPRRPRRDRARPGLVRRPRRRPGGAGVAPPGVRPRLPRPHRAAAAPGRRGRRRAVRDVRGARLGATSRPDSRHAWSRRSGSGRSRTGSASRRPTSPSADPTRRRVVSPARASRGRPRGCGWTRRGSCATPTRADRRREAQLEDRVERLVGVGQHRAEQPVELVGGDRAQRQPAVEVDVADGVDRERDAEHPQVALEQPAVDPLVVLVGLAGRRTRAARTRARRRRAGTGW